MDRIQRDWYGTKKKDNENAVALHSMAYLFPQLHEQQFQIAHEQRPFGFSEWHSTFKTNHPSVPTSND